MRTSPSMVKRAPLVVAFAVVAPPPRPPLLYVLASFGLILGGFGASYSSCQAASLLQTRDQFAAGVREEAERRLPTAPDQLVTKDELMHMIERQAEVIYSRRGVALPLDAMNFILSALLFAGCGRALRGHSWGLSAWSLAAIASVPYTLLDCAFSIIQSRDLQAVYRESGGMFGTLMASSVRITILITMIKSALEILYFGVCVVYLRRAVIRKLFTDDAARS
jgi:hypothetical protein